MQWTDYRPYKFFSLRKNNAKWMGWEGFKDKDEAINRGNYLGVKLTEHMLKLTPCFQLDIWKKIFRIYRKHNTKRWVAYLPHQILFHRSQMSRKKGYGKKTFKKSIMLVICDFDLSKTSIPKNNRTWVIWALKKKVFLWCSWKYLFT